MKKYPIVAGVGAVIMSIAFLPARLSWSADEAPAKNTYTLDELVSAPVTAVVGQRINLRTRVYWENHHPICVPGIECPKDKLVASDLMVFFENGDTHVPERFHGEQRGNFRIESPVVTKAFNKDKIEEYYFNGVLLDREITYVLTGVIAYRDSIGKPPIDNPDFISQSNKVTYWRQTFEFSPESISKSAP